MFQQPSNRRACDVPGHFQTEPDVQVQEPDAFPWWEGSSWDSTDADCRRVTPEEKYSRGPPERSRVTQPGVRRNSARRGIELETLE